MAALDHLNKGFKPLVPTKRDVACKRGIRFIQVFLLYFLSVSFAQMAEFIYTDYDPSFDVQIELSQVDIPRNLEKTLSPNKTRGFWTASPDFMVESPWSTSVFIEKDEQTTLKLELRNHANIFPRILWLNDELMHIKVWWGRAVGSEFILHIPKEDFIYKSMFHWTQVMATTGDASASDLPNFTLRLKHIQGAAPDFHSLTVTNFQSDFNDVRQVSLEVLAPVYTECFLAMTQEELVSAYSLLTNFLDERAANVPPRPVETVCRNCTIYQMTWTINDSPSESFEFSEQRPFRYPAMDGLCPLIEGLLERMVQEGECAA